MIERKTDGIHYHPKSLNMKKVILPFLLLCFSGCRNGISGEYESVKAGGILDTKTILHLKPDGKVMGYMRFIPDGTYTTDSGKIQIIFNGDTAAATLSGDTLFIEGEAFVKKH